MKNPLSDCHLLNQLRRQSTGVGRETLDRYFGLACVPRTHIKSFRVASNLMLFLKPSREEAFLAEMEAIQPHECRNRKAFQAALQDPRSIGRMAQDRARRQSADRAAVMYVQGTDYTFVMLSTSGVTPSTLHNLFNARVPVQYLDRTLSRLTLPHNQARAYLRYLRASPGVKHQKVEEFEVFVDAWDLHMAARTLVEHL